MDNENDQAGRLALIDRHIAEGLRRIAVQTERVQKLRGRGADTASAEQLLQIMKETLENFLEFRRLSEQSQRLQRSQPSSIASS